ncbi:MAG: hypothetical protein EOO75_14085 [Myxococcales bacterium]|nr:MAG: hypothetical protein EOO75_14085 [Myxococcales bacterium]
MTGRVEGLFDRATWPGRLVARVVEPGPSPRLHGYAVSTDLARHCGSSEVSWLAARGELPSASEREAFEVACVLLAPVHVGEAPAHAAVLARILSTTASAVVAVASTALAEQAQHERAGLAPLRGWLDRGEGDAPAACLDPDPDAGTLEAHRWLRAQAVRWFGPSHPLASAPPLRRVALGHALLHALGFTDDLSVTTVLVTARLPVVIAEASRQREGGVTDYPARLPDYMYVDDEVTS